MKITQENHGKTAVLRLSGEFTNQDDQTFSDTIESNLRENIKFFVLNLKDVTYLCSMDIAMIMKTYHIIAKQQGRMAICCVPPTVLRMLSITRISVIIPVFTSEKEAVANFS